MTDLHTLPSTRINRRKMLNQGATLIAAPAFLTYGSSLRAATYESELVFACVGGTTQRMFEENLFPEFTKRTGTKIIYVAGQPADTLAKMRVQKANPAIDVAWLAGGTTYSAIDEGLLMDMDLSKIPSFAQMSPNVGAEKAALPFGLTVDVIIYNANTFAKQGLPAPTSWFDMWGPKFKGHVGLYSINVASTIAFIAKVSQLLTGDYKNLDAAFAKFKELRPNMLNFYPTAGGYETAMQQGDCWIGQNTAVRGLEMKKMGMPIETVVPKEGTVGYQTFLGITNKTKRPNAAHAFVDYMLSAEVQQKMVGLIGYSPVNSKATVPAGQSNYFPPMSTVMVPDWKYLRTQIPSIVARWNREVER